MSFLFLLVWSVLIVINCVQKSYLLRCTINVEAILVYPISAVRLHSVVGSFQLYGGYYREASQWGSDFSQQKRKGG